MTFNATLGYHNIIRDIGIGDYPRRGDCIKIEEIGDGYITFRVPGFFDRYDKSAGNLESDEPHRLALDEILVFDEEKEVTCHKYRWYSELTVSIDKLDNPD